jgi:cytochrome c-type biogenesis protein CcmH
VSAPTRSGLNRRAKGWMGWALLVLVAIGLLAVGATRDSGPRTPDERIEAISKRLACPVCQGESVYESRNTASNQIREAIRQGVDEGRLSDEQIIQRITVAYEGEELLVPTGSGVEALAWALPAAAFVLGAAGLVVAFRRWQRSARSLGAATPEDYELVARALAVGSSEEQQDEAPEGDELVARALAAGSSEEQQDDAPDRP